MSNSAFHHKDSKLSAGMYYGMAIMATHFNEEGLKADSVKCATQKLMPMLHRPSKLGRSHNRRYMKLQASIEVAIERGFLRYSDTDCKLTLTRAGRKAIRNQRGHRHARSRPQRYVNTSPIRVTA